MTSRQKGIGAVLSCALVALAVVPVAAGAATWTRANTTKIGPIPADPGPAIPYPSTIAVSDLPGKLTKATVTFVGLRHTQGSDIDAAIRGPGGQELMLMSDSCANIFDLAGRDLTFDDSAPTAIGDDSSCPAGTYRPANRAEQADAFPAPGPVAPFGTALSALNGGSANGNWSLYVVDDGPIAQGDMLGGWRIQVTTDAPDACAGAQGTVFGTDEGDELRGTKGKDVILGFGGRDEIKGLGGKDVICGGAGKDTLIGGGGKDKLLGQGGKDKCVGGGGGDAARSCETEKSI